MSELNQSAHERAHKTYTAFLQRLSPDGTQKTLAVALGVSEATITRWKEQAENTCMVIAYMGLKLVPVEKVCTDPGELKFLRNAYAKCKDHAPHLLNEAEE